MLMRLDLEQKAVKFEGCKKFSVQRSHCTPAEPSKWVGLGFCVLAYYHRRVHSWSRKPPDLTIVDTVTLVM